VWNKDKIRKPIWPFVADDTSLRHNDSIVRSSQ
jgi:hypothetical protein